MSAVLFAFLILVFLGVILSIGLYIADKKLSVSKDEVLVKLEEVMPGANCGGCGFAGCSDYANAVFCKKAEVGLCAPGGQDLANKMGQIMGMEVGKVEKKVAYVFCDTSCNENIKNYDYKGIEDCNAAALLFNGDNACKYGCLHMLSCAKVCASEAISISKDGKIEVDRNKCIGCGKCVSVCPHNVIKLVPYELSYAVKCNNHDKGAQVMKACKKGCIGCKICETKHPESGIKVEDNLAFTSVGFKDEELVLAAETCPKKIIKKVN